MDDKTVQWVQKVELYVARQTPKSLAAFHEEMSVRSLNNGDGQWHLLFRQDTNVEKWKQDTWSVNPTHPEAITFARLDQMEAFRSWDGQFYFMMRWPGLCKSHPTECKGFESNVWSQESNPRFTTSGGVVKYRSISTPCEFLSWILRCLTKFHS